jgi:hypothetical protein
MSSLQPSPSLSYEQLRLPAPASSSCSPKRLAAGAPASASSTKVARLLLLGPRQRRNSDAVSAGRKQQVSCIGQLHYSMTAQPLLSARRTTRHTLHVTSLPQRAAEPDRPCPCKDVRLVLQIGCVLHFCCSVAVLLR